MARENPSWDAPGIHGELLELDFDISERTVLRYLARRFSNAAPAGSLLCRVSDGRLPSEEEKVVTTKSAPVGLKEPAESFLHAVSDAYTSELDGSAVGTARGE
jgi:hypothetical protein